MSFLELPDPLQYAIAGGVGLLFLVWSVMAFIYVFGNDKVSQRAERVMRMLPFVRGRAGDDQDDPLAPIEWPPD